MNPMSQSNPSPPGFGVQQSSATFGVAVQSGRGCRTPRRCRASVGFTRFIGFEASLEYPDSFPVKSVAVTTKK
jgi:hypothetical protein